MHLGWSTFNLNQGLLIMVSKNTLENYRFAASSPHDSAKSLPFDVYNSNEVAELERKRIFSSSWVFACAESRLPDPGDYFALNLFGEPLVVLKGKDRNLRVLSNVCRHRGTPILDEGFGNTKTLVCPYHAWTYNHQGELLGAPFSQAGEVDKANLCLPSFYVEVWRGLIFITLEKQSDSIYSRLQGLNRILDELDSDSFIHVNVGSVEHWKSNWKLVMENAMESYHLFKVHKGTLETVTPTKQSFYLQGDNSWSLTSGKMKGADGMLTKCLSGDKYELYSHYFLIMLPPNFVGIVTYESFDWISVMPTLEGGCVVQSEGLAKKKRKANTTTQAFVDQFFAEDKAICERGQTGMRSRKSSGGPLLDVERIVVDFHHYLARQLFDAECKTEHRSSAIDKFI